MVPIVPSGAVELTLFREPSGPMPEAKVRGLVMSKLMGNLVILEVSNGFQIEHYKFDQIFAKK